MANTENQQRDTTKLLPGGFYFTNERSAGGRNLYRDPEGRLFTMHAGNRDYNYIANEVRRNKR